MSVAAFALPRAGVVITPQLNSILVWGGLACVLVGYVGRMVTKE